MEQDLNSQSPESVSPDGQWRWDGSQWVPNRTPPGQPEAERASVTAALGRVHGPRSGGFQRNGALAAGIAAAVVATLVAAGAAIGVGASKTSDSTASDIGASTVDGLSLPGGCVLTEMATPYTRWTASMTYPIKNSRDRDVHGVVMIAEILRDGQVIGVDGLGPFSVPAEPTTNTSGVPLDRDWPIDPNTDTCTLSLASAGSEPATGWIGGSTDNAASADITYWSGEFGDVMAMENSGSNSIMLFLAGFHYACSVGEIQGDRWSGQQEFFDADSQPASYRLERDERNLVLTGDDGERTAFSRISLEEAHRLLSSDGSSGPEDIQPSHTCG